MQSKIITTLKSVEKREKVTILYAVESGSRGWGFSSKDSDYDVRFIYIHPLDWYLSIEREREVIEYPNSNSLDIAGWDLKKALVLFSKSNPPLYEWLNSPIIYIERGVLAQSLRSLIQTFYSSESSLYHYFHMAKGNYRDYLKGGKVRVKKYFYVIRPILACMWIEKKKTVPPMGFENLLRAQKLDERILDEVENLLMRKRAGEELGMEDRIEIINEFLDEKIRYFEEFIKTKNFAQKFLDPKRNEVLNNLFRDIVKTNWSS